MPENLTTEVRLSRLQGQDIDRPIRLTITDKASGLEFLEMRMTQKELGALVSGDGTYDYTTDDGPQVTVRSTQHLGKRMEHLTEHFKTQDEAEEWGGRMVADGWHTYSTSRTNRPSIQATVRRYV